MTFSKRLDEKFKEGNLVKKNNKQAIWRIYIFIYQPFALNVPVFYHSIPTILKVISPNFTFSVVMLQLPSTAPIVCKYSPWEGILSRLIVYTGSSPTPPPTFPLGPAAPQGSLLRQPNSCVNLFSRKGPVWNSISFKTELHWTFKENNPALHQEN